MSTLIKIVVIVCFIIFDLIAALAIFTLLELIIDKLTDFIAYLEDLLEDIVDHIKDRKKK